MEKDIKAKYEKEIADLSLEKAYLLGKNGSLERELDLLYSKVNLLKEAFKIIRIKADIEGNKIPFEIEVVLDEFFNLTTFKTNIKV